MKRSLLTDHRKVVLLILGILFSGVFVVSAQMPAVNDPNTPTVIFLVRHAEQDREAKGDPLLTPQGQARAELLAAILSKTTVSAAYATKVLRAAATAAPLVKAKGIELSNYRIEDDETLFIKNILQKHKGKNILVIGHSGNIAELLNAATRSKQYDDKAIDQFSDFYIITFVGDNPGIVTRLKYGQ